MAGAEDMLEKSWETDRERWAARQSASDLAHHPRESRLQIIDIGETSTVLKQLVNMISSLFLKNNSDSRVGVRLPS